MDSDICRQHIVADDSNYLAELLCTSEADIQPFLQLLQDPAIRDDILDTPVLISTMLEMDDRQTPSPRLYLYLGLRHYLVKQGLGNRDLADYVTEVCVHFLYKTRWVPGSPLMRPAEYVSQLAELLSSETANERWGKVLCLHSHLGHYTLWLTGLLPGVVATNHSAGGPGIEEYENIGRTNFQKAASFEAPLSHMFHQLGEHFSEVRGALNSLADSQFL